MKHFILVVSFLFSGYVQAQLVDDFSDGDFSVNPAWVGDIESWQVSAGSLKSINQVAISQFCLSTPSKLLKNTQWSLSVNLQFNTSSANYVDIYLASDSANIKSGVKNGYFVRIGGTKDEICLYKRANGVVALLIDGIDGVTNKSTNTISLKVLCSESFVWKLERDLSGLSSNYFSEGTITDSSTKSSNWFGILVVQSTASFFQKHVFDNIIVKEIVKDTVQPKVVSTKILNAKTVEVLFDEEVDSNWVFDASNFKLFDRWGALHLTKSIQKDSSSSLKYYVILESTLVAEGTYYLIVSSPKDLVGNRSANFNGYSIFQKPQIAAYKQIRISELMTDPVPAIGLPEKEYIELHNTSNQAFELKDYVLFDPSTLVKLPSYHFQPNEYLIVCKSSDTTDFSPFGRVLGLEAMPSLNNSSDVITLKNSNGDLVDQVSYALAWYRDSQKDDGGFSLELIDPANSCLGAVNWKASKSLLGGTPGNVNSVDSILKDEVAPSILSAVAISKTQLRLHFSEKVDSASFVNTNFSINQGIGIKSVEWNDDSLDQIMIYLESQLATGTEYLLTINSLKDCSGNNKLKINSYIMLAEKPSAGDILINEVLFNPLPYGADFVELFNPTEKYLDLKGWTLANLKNDTIANRKLLFKNSFILKPNEYVVLTEDKNNILNVYIKSVADRIVEVPVLPTFYDDLGNVILMDASENVIDRLDYNQSMHSPLVPKKEGVSLEKINPSLATNEPNNWTSSSKESGYATPGYANSQYIGLGISDEDVAIEPQLITPNGDGDNDFMVFRIQSDKIGSLRNILIFDVMGREVKRLLKNGFAGTQTLVQWDGTDEANNLLPVGHYIVWFEAIDKSGSVLHYKKKVVVGARF